MGRAADRNTYRPNGPHTEMTARVPPELHQTIRAEAEALGISMSRLVVEVLEERFGTDDQRRQEGIGVPVGVN